MPPSTFMLGVCSPAQPAGLPAQPALLQAPAGQSETGVLQGSPAADAVLNQRAVCVGAASRHEYAGQRLAGALGSDTPTQSKASTSQVLFADSCHRASCSPVGLVAWTHWADSPALPGASSSFSNGPVQHCSPPAN